MRWLNRVNQPATTRARILAVPHAGGWPSAFTPWREHAHAGVELAVVEMPGRAARAHEPAASSLPEIIEPVLAALESSPAPTTVVGHSFGAVAGYEIARAMQERGMPVARFVASARQPPAFPSVAPFSHTSTDEDLLARLSDMGGLGPGLQRRPEVARQFLDAIRADLRLMETHTRPLARARFPITALLAEDDPVVMAERMPLWSLETTGEFTLDRFTGGHFFIYNQDVAARLVRRLGEELLAVAARDPLPKAS